MSRVTGFASCNNVLLFGFVLGWVEGLIEEWMGSDSIGVRVMDIGVLVSGFGKLKFATGRSWDFFY
jgi:hypothetical protein